MDTANSNPSANLPLYFLLIGLVHKKAPSNNL